MALLSPLHRVQGHTTFVYNSNLIVLDSEPCKGTHPGERLLRVLQREPGATKWGRKWDCVVKGQRKTKREGRVSAQSKELQSMRAHPTGSKIKERRIWCERMDGEDGGQTVIWHMKPLTGDVAWLIFFFFAPLHYMWGPSASSGVTSLHLIKFHSIYPASDGLRWVLWRRPSGITGGRGSSLPTSRGL